MFATVRSTGGVHRSRAAAALALHLAACGSPPGPPADAPDPVLEKLRAGEAPAELRSGGNPAWTAEIGLALAEDRPWKSDADAFAALGEEFREHRRGAPHAVTHGLVQQVVGQHVVALDAVSLPIEFGQVERGVAEDRRRLLDRQAVEPRRLGGVALDPLAGIIQLGHLVVGRRHVPVHQGGEPFDGLVVLPRIDHLLGAADAVPVISADGGLGTTVEPGGVPGRHASGIFPVGRLAGGDTSGEDGEQGGRGREPPRRVGGGGRDGLLHGGFLVERVDDLECHCWPRPRKASVWRCSSSR